MFLIYIVCEAIYYLYSKHIIYKQLENIHYNDLNPVIPYKSTFKIYKYLLCYFKNDHDVNAFFNKAFLNKDSINIYNIKKVLSQIILNNEVCTNKGIRLCRNIYINHIINVIRPKLTILNNDTNTQWDSSIVMTNKLDIVHKPLAFYIFTYIIRIVFNFYMYMIGFTYIIDSTTQLRVWIKYNKAADNKTPLVFFHGLGFGIIPYISKILQFSVDRKTLILPEYPNFSYDLYKFPPPSNDNIVSSLYNTLVKLDIDLVDTIGHSYGALVMNIFQVKYPHICDYKTYIEPMSFNIHVGEYATSAYKFPSTKEYNIIDYILWSLDAEGVANAFPYAKSGESSAVIVYIEANKLDSTDGKGTPTSLILSDVEAAINFSPDTSLPLYERGRRPTDVRLYVEAITPRDIIITVPNFAGLTTQKAIDIRNALEAYLEGVRPFIAGADVLTNKNDTKDLNSIIQTISNTYPGSSYGTVSFTVDGIAQTSFIFTLGDIPYLSSLNIT
jgi:hypothetical protein